MVLAHNLCVKGTFSLAFPFFKAVSFCIPLMDLLSWALSWKEPRVRNSRTTCWSYFVTWTCWQPAWMIMSCLFTTEQGKWLWSWWCSFGAWLNTTVSRSEVSQQPEFPSIERNQMWLKHIPLSMLSQIVEVEGRFEQVIFFMPLSKWQSPTFLSRIQERKVTGKIFS